MAIRLFGLTGGVASGKSTVAARFRQAGLAVIDADAIARELVGPSSEALRELCAAFGTGIVTADGALDRKKLGAMVFADERHRARLNAIMHPRIAAETERRARGLERAGAELACYEAALLVENGRADDFRPLVVVAAPADVQIRRLRERDGLSLAEARQRVGAQLPLDRKAAVADVVIDNGGSLGELERQADQALGAVRRAVARMGGD